MRLIDADELRSAFRKRYGSFLKDFIYDAFYSVVDDAKTVNPEDVVLKWHKGKNIPKEIIHDNNYEVLAECERDYGDGNGTVVYKGFAIYFSEDDYRDNYNSENGEPFLNQVGWYVLEDGTPNFDIKRWMLIPYCEEDVQ